MLSMQQKMQLTNNLLRLADNYGAARGLRRSTVFRHVCNNPRLARQLERGENFRVGSYDEIVQSFSDQWPSGAEWPAAIWRPEPKVISNHEETV